ncbi:MAG: bifunctional folylpolyglutamate synthase/dihydrofolate synthase [Anaerolineae bacterium]|nr:bifunctional folylpolyglutamate synthase/dihydrofolate synthase [Anaerolineae bacterium]
MDISSLNQEFKRIEQMITHEAEWLIDPREREIEFHHRLERTHRLMAQLGHPQDKFDKIHIGGTSGKGSIAMIGESILLSMGLRVGTHTSPYLQTPLEKVRINGRLMEPQRALSLIPAVLDAVEHEREQGERLGSPHYAEAWLGLALTHFAEQSCQIGFIEVGMGGRYDSTNIITPRVSIISTIHYDHTRVLGETLEEIAFHKSGIIKPGVPVVVGEVSPQALRVVEAEAARQGSRPIRLGRDVHYHPIDISQHGGRFSYHGLGLSLNNLEIGLLGGHQFTNAASALAALEIYADEQGMELQEQSIREGLERVRFAGRLEVVQQKPTVVLDGAHNEEKMSALIAALSEVFHDKRPMMVLGMLETKNALSILSRLATLAKLIITTEPRVKGKPAIPANELAKIAREAGARATYEGGTPLEALEHAIGIAEPDDLIVVTGSLYLIGQVRPYWYRMEEIVGQQTMFPYHNDRENGA